MIEQARAQLREDLVSRIASAVRGSQLYASTHPLVGRNISALQEAVVQMHSLSPTLTVGFVGDDVIVGDAPLPRPLASIIDLGRRLRSRGIERLTIERGVTREEIERLVRYLSETPAAQTPADDSNRTPDFEHVRIGRIAIEDRVESRAADVATIKRLYSEAVAAVENIWETARRDGVMDAKTAQSIVHGLAQAVSENRSALLALTTLKAYDNYTFTHMVNVSILTMSQAKSLGVEAALLREFGLAALMHDIGKVKVPVDILQKPDKLTDTELAIMRRHPIDGAEILLRTPDIPHLVAVVAFEHHLRLDGNGYPAGVSRAPLNLATVLTSIADVYDAMRSQRAYQQVFPGERVVAVLRRNDGKQFDQNLVRRFVQLLGIYPAGTAVRLDTGHIGVVRRVNASDAHRPRVRVLLSPDGSSLERPYDVDLWAVTPGMGPSSVAAPVDAESLGIDPVGHM